MLYISEKKIRLGSATRLDGVPDHSVISNFACSGGQSVQGATSTMFQEVEAAKILNCDSAVVGGDHMDFRRSSRTVRVKRQVQACNLQADGNTE